MAKYGLSLRGRYTADTEYHVYGTIPSKYGQFQLKLIQIRDSGGLWQLT